MPFVRAALSMIVYKRPPQLYGVSVGKKIMHLVVEVLPRHTKMRFYRFKAGGVFHQYESGSSMIHHHAALQHPSLGTSRYRCLQYCLRHGMQRAALLPRGFHIRSVGASESRQQAGLFRHDVLLDGCCTKERRSMLLELPSLRERDLESHRAAHTRKSD